MWIYCTHNAYIPLGFDNSTLCQLLITSFLLNYGYYYDSFTFESILEGKTFMQNTLSVYYLG